MARKRNAKVFYKWFDTYYSVMEQSYKPYQKNLKRRVLTVLNLNRRMVLLKLSKAQKFYQQNLKFKAFYGLLKNLNMEREEKHI